LLFAQAVDQLAASTAGHATFRLTVTLAAGSQNMYALFGRAGSLMAFPAAFQVAAPFGSNTAGVNPAFYAVSPDAEFDSWLTIGITDSEPAGAISSIGIDWSGWSEAAGLGTADGAVFYMDPDTGATMLGGAVHDGVQSPPPGPIVVAQLTVPVAGSSFTATAGAQGRSANGAPDWEELNLSWSTAAGGGSPPPPPALPSGGGEHCDDLLQGVVNSCVGSDGEGNPIARSHGCAGCIDPATGAPLAVFIGMVRPAGQPSCVMPNEMDADVMMACLCADPPTCTRGAASHNTALIPPPPPAAASQDCHAGQQPSAGGSCQPCMQNHFSEDGTACLICNAGSGVNDARTNCWPCAGNNYSPDGTACTACPVNKQPNAGHTECETVAAPPPPPGTTNAGRTEEEDSIASAVVTQVMIDSVPGYTTYRVALHVIGDATNVYTIYGNTDGNERAPMEIPAAWQEPTPFGANVGGVSTAFFAVGTGSAQYDSWLTVGDTEAAAPDAISSIGIDFESWNENAGLQITDGAVFWMDPDLGPAVNEGKDPIVMQLTVPNACDFHGVVNAQGRTVVGDATRDGNWDARNIQFHGGPPGGSPSGCQVARAPPPPPPPPPGVPPPPPTRTPPPPPYNSPTPSPEPAPMPAAGASGDAAAPADDGDSGSSVGTIFAVVLVVGIGAVVVKKKQEGGGGGKGPDGGIYATNIGDTDL
jgi:hypothetical protein